MNALYRMADLNIEMESHYEYVHRFCSDYRSDGFPTLMVRVTQKDIEKMSASGGNE